MKLFAIYIGGEAPGANIEVHDMRFVVAPSLRETYRALRRQWWGAPGTLHIDCWAQIDHADGYDVMLRDEPFDGPERLFYVNLGGYDGREFSERHRNMFVVADGVAKAKSRALQSVRDWYAPHRDDLYEAEQAFALDQAAADQRLHIHLSKAGAARPLAFTCDYIPLRGRAKAGPQAANWPERNCPSATRQCRSFRGMFALPSNRLSALRLSIYEPRPMHAFG